MSNLSNKLRDGVVWYAAGPDTLGAEATMEEAADRIDVLEAALRQAVGALMTAQSGLQLCYESAIKGFSDETLLH